MPTLSRSSFKHQELNLPTLLGIGFQSSDASFTSVFEVLSFTDATAISIDGKPVREIPGPKGLLFVGQLLRDLPRPLGQPPATL